MQEDTRAATFFSDTSLNLLRKTFIIVFILCIMTIVFLQYDANTREFSISPTFKTAVVSMNATQILRSAATTIKNSTFGRVIQHLANQSPGDVNVNRRDPCSVPKRNTGVEDLLCMKKPDFLQNFKNPCWYETTRTTKTLRCLPYFHLFGVCKSGTSDFFRRIYKHPQLVPNKGIFGKEIWYWSWNRLRLKTIAGHPTPNARFTDFLSKFKTDVISAQTTTYKNFTDYHPLVTGHGDPMELWDHFGWKLIPQNNPKANEPEFTTPQTIRHLNPDVKLVLMLRNPVDRLYSHFFHAGMGRTAEDFHTKTVDAIKIWEECTKLRSIRSCIYDDKLKPRMKSPVFTSMYSQHLKEWLRDFPRKQMFIFRNEDYHSDMKGTLLDFFKFLDVDTPSPELVQEMTSMGQFYETKGKKRAGPMLNKTRTLLKTFYQPFNKELAEILSDRNYLWE